jgi:hypothetical protein
MSSQTQSIPFLIPNRSAHSDIAGWEREVLRPENIEITRDFKVVYIGHYKSTNPPYHEHLRVKATRGNGSNTETGWLLVDRGRSTAPAISVDSPLRKGDLKDPPTKPTFSRRLTASTSSVDIRSSSNSSSASLSPEAADGIYIARRGDASLLGKYWNDGSVLVAKVEKSSKTPAYDDLSVAEFAALLQIVSNKYEQYEPTNHNCYWFAGIIYQCVRHRFPSSFEHESRTKELVRAGKFLSLGNVSAPITKNDMDEICGVWDNMKTNIKGMKTREEVSPHDLLKSRMQPLTIPIR